jgi:hypothetical protein
MLAVMKIALWFIFIDYIKALRKLSGSLALMGGLLVKDEYEK